MAHLMKTPREVEIALTSRCNLRCRYCSHFTSPGEVDDLPASEWLRFFQELNHCSVLRVTLEGGEVFCRPDLRQLLQGIADNRMRFTILSNGTLIDDDLAACIASLGRCDGVQVSIDGSRPSTNDPARGAGTHRRAVAAVQTLMRHGVPVRVRVTIHKFNVKDLEEVARLLLEELGLPSFSTNSAGYLGLCRRNSAFLQLDVQERMLAMESLLRLARRYPGRISATAGPLAEAWNWLEMTRALESGLESLPGGGYLSGCGGMWSRIGVRPDGVIVPCIQLSHLELGRINRDSLEEIWQQHPLLWRLRERRRIPLAAFPGCRDCPYRNYCTGNCPALAYSMTGELFAPSPDACLRKFLADGGRLPEKSLLLDTQEGCGDALMPQE